ncbi:MAG TPA: two-component regulator propeller domain-containing protein [Anaerolineales bacterium]|nr:two-component regulator propeller domain-containing protein [Anaerolineales bacterium]
MIRPPQDIFALAEQGNTLWAGGVEGVYQLDRRTGTLVQQIPFDPPLEYVRALLVDADGRLWIGHNQGLTCYQGPGNWQTYSEAEGLPDERVNALALDAAGRLWVGTWGGAAVQTQGGWQTLTLAGGLLDDMVNVILPLPDGGMWFGSYVAPRGGLSYRSAGGDWQYFSIHNGLPHNNITSLVAVSAEQVWAGSGLNDRGGAAELVQSAGGSWQIARLVTLENGLAGEKVRSLALAPDGGLWFGSEYDGLAVLHSNVFEVYTTQDGLSHDEIKAILFDADGAAWVATRDGLTSIAPYARP